MGDLQCLRRHGVPTAHLHAGFSWIGGPSPGAALPSLPARGQPQVLSELPGGKNRG